MNKTGNVCLYWNNSDCNLFICTSFILLVMLTTELSPPPVLHQLFSSGPRRLKETKFTLPVAQALGKNKAKSAEMAAKTSTMPGADDINDTARHQDEREETTGELVVKEEAKEEVEKKKEEEGLTGTGQTSHVSGSIQPRFVHLKTLKYGKKTNRYS